MKSSDPLSLLAMAIVVALISFTSCKKYDEGPTLSLKSKKARVANEWKIEYAYNIYHGRVVTQDYEGETWEFDSKGEFIERDNGVIDKSGTWEFISNKESLQITKPNDIDYYDILKLKDKEMWLIDNKEELHLIPN